jgi:hypothetical protein
MPCLGLGLGTQIPRRVLFTGLLDEFSGAAAAYSLRALSSAWLAGDVVEVRRSSDSSTQGFTAGQVADGTLEAFCGVGDGFVSTWYDQSGNANDATQATTTAQPKIVDAGALVTGGIDFDGVDDSLFTSLPVLGDTFSIFCAADASALTSNLGIYSQHINGSSNRFAFSESSAGNAYAFFKEPTAIFSTTTIGTSRQLTTTIKNGTSAAIHIDGGANEGGTLASATVLSAKFAIASANEGTAAFSPLLASEIIIYNSDQTANRAAIETNINDFYSIY